MSLAEILKKWWTFLKADTPQSWLVSIVLMVIIIKFILFPVLSSITATPLPLVVVESCSMYHNTNFEDWWNAHAAWYESRNVSKNVFGDSKSNQPFTDGLNKGDIILVWGRSTYKEGDVIIFTAPTKYPIIHRVIETTPLSTKGDNNIDQLADNVEQDIPQEKIIGKAVARVPLLGWIKLIFFEFQKPSGQRGLCR